MRADWKKVITTFAGAATIFMCILPSLTIASFTRFESSHNIADSNDLTRGASYNPDGVLVDNIIKAITDLAEYPVLDFSISITVLNNGHIGATWLEIKGSTYIYNYARFGPDGQIILNKRAFFTNTIKMTEYGIDWENSIPMIRFIEDDNDNIWIAYSFEAGNKWRIGWLKINATHEVVEQATFSTNAGRFFEIIGADNHGLHLLQKASGSIDNFYYINTTSQKMVKIGWRFAFMEAGIDLANARYLLLSLPFIQLIKDETDYITYACLSNQGEILFDEKILDWQDYIATTWENCSLVSFCEVYKDSNGINLIFTYDHDLHLIQFTPEGQIILPDKAITGSIFEVEKFPDQITQLIEFIKGKWFHIGIKDYDKLYLWSIERKS